MSLGLLVCHLIPLIHCGLFSSGHGYCPHVPSTLEWNVRISDEKPHIIQFLERGAPLERASAEKLEGGGIDHQDNCVCVGLSLLKGCFIAESQRCGRWRRKRGEDTSQHLKFGVSNHAVALLRGQLPHPGASTEAGAWVCVELRALGKLRKK